MRPPLRLSNRSCIALPSGVLPSLKMDKNPAQSRWVIYCALPKDTDLVTIYNMQIVTLLACYFIIF